MTEHTPRPHATASDALNEAGAGNCSAHAQAVTGELGEALSSRFPGSSVRLDGPISERNNSRVFHARIDGRQIIEAAVKQCTDLRSQSLDPREAQRQFDALTRVNNALAGGGGGRHGVPTPLANLPEQAAYAMSWVSGSSLTHRMRRVSALLDGTRWFAETGAWLAHFHRAGPCRSAPTDLAQPLVVIGQLEASPLPDAHFLRALRTLRHTAEACRAAPVTVSWLHGDCKTDNFMLSGDRLYAIDISLAHENAVEYDLAQFCNALALSFANPRQLHLMLIRSRLEAAFLHAYQTTGPAVSRIYMNWLRLLFCTSYWHTSSRRQKSALRRKALHVVFSRLTTRLIREIEALA